MSWFSFHGGHSGQFCRHARGTLAETLTAAAARGFTTYGLSEHAPRDRAQDLYPEERPGTPADLAAAFAAYTQEAARLRTLWAGRLEVLIGFETEALPPDGFPSRMRALRASGPFDYVVGSVHHVGDLPIDWTASSSAAAEDAIGGRDALDRAYFDTVAALVTALRPEVVGHLDVIRKFRGSDVTFAAGTGPHIERALEAIGSARSMLDVNAAPARRGDGPVYPAPALLARAHAMGIPVTLGDDSHGPETVGVGLDACLAAISAAGYREVHTLRRRGGAIVREAVPLADLRPGPPLSAPATDR